MDVFRRHHGNAAVTVLLVVPGKERLAERPGVLDASKAVREVRPVLERLELRLRVRVVVAEVRGRLA